MDTSQVTLGKQQRDKIQLTQNADNILSKDRKSTHRKQTAVTVEIMMARKNLDYMPIHHVP